MSVRNILDPATGKIRDGLLPSATNIDLISPVYLYPPAGYTSGVAVISSDGNNASEYGGSITLNPGSNAPAGGAGVGVNIKSTPYSGEDGVAGVSVEIGTDGATAGATAGFVENHLYIAGTYGLSEVNDPVYNPVQMFVNANPGATTTTPETINEADPVENIRIITLGNTPADYNYFKMFLDFRGVQTFSNADDPRVRFYLTNTSNGAYNAATSIVSWAQPVAPTQGDTLILEDQPLVYMGVATSNQLYLNFTFAGAVDGAVGFADPTGITTDYAIEASKVSQM